MFFVTTKRASNNHILTTIHHAKTIQKPRSNPVEIPKPPLKTRFSPQTKKSLPRVEKTLTLCHSYFSLKETAEVFWGEEA